VYYSPDKDELYAISGAGGVVVLNSADGGEKTFLNTFPESQAASQAAYVGISDYHADEGWLALGALNGDIKVWDVPQRLSMVTLTGAGSSITALRFSPDGSHLAAAYLDGRVQVWDWRSRTPAYTPEALSLSTGQNTLYNQLRYTSDGAQLVGMSASLGVVWDATSGLRRSVLQTGEGAAAHVFKVVPGQDLVLTGGIGANITLWNTDTGQQVSSLAGFGGDFPLDAAFSPDGKLLFTAQLHTDVALWSLENLAQGTIGRSNVLFENKNILNLEWTSDGFLVLMFDSRGTIDVWGIP
jgi:WD40 repeat protein